MNIDEAIGRLKGIKYASHTAYFKNLELMYQDVDAIETLINEYSNLKQIEEAHRIENGELRKELKQEKEKNKLLIQGKFREVADKNSYIKDMYISKDKIKEILQKHEYTHVEDPYRFYNDVKKLFEEER